MRVTAPVSAEKPMQPPVNQTVTLPSAMVPAETPMSKRDDSHKSEDWHQYMESVDRSLERSRQTMEREITRAKDDFERAVRYANHTRDWWWEHKE